MDTVQRPGIPGLSAPETNPSSLLQPNDFVCQIDIVVNASQRATIKLYCAELLHHGRPVHYWEAEAYTSIDGKSYKYGSFTPTDRGLTKDGTLSYFLAEMHGPLVLMILGPGHGRATPGRF